MNNRGGRICTKDSAGKQKLQNLLEEQLDRDMGPDFLQVLDLPSVNLIKQGHPSDEIAPSRASGIVSLT